MRSGFPAFRIGLPIGGTASTPIFGPLLTGRSAAALAVAILTIFGMIFLTASRASAASDPAKVFTNERTIELARAITDDDEAKVRDLARDHASLADQGEAGVTLLQWAMLRDRPAMVELLLQLGADPAQRGYGGQTALHTAAMAKAKPYLKIFLDHGADLNIRGGPTDAPVLSEALMNGNRDAVTLLLARHADPNATDRQSDTPLHVAAQISDYKSMLVLLEAGADPTLRNRQGKTFGAYFAIHPKESMMSWEAKSARLAVQQWLGGHGYPSEGK